MSSQTVEFSPTAVSTGSFFDRLARQTLERIIGKLDCDRITLRDETGERTFGTRSAEGLHAIVDVRRPSFYRRILTGGSLGAAEAFLDGDWTTDDLTVLIRILIRNMHVAEGINRGLSRVTRVLARGLHWWRRNTRAGSRRNIEAHYDLGNDFFRLFLDETMMYSSGIFERPDSTLHEASVAKIDRICRELDLRPTDHLLEIGTGWGGFALHAARHYGCRVTTTTISREQFDLARQRIDDAGLNERVHVLLKDYRDLTGQYDKLVSIEMIEAVGHQFLDMYFRKCGELLKPAGLMLLQGIVMNEQRYAEYLRSADFIQRYVFPGGCLPSVLAIGQAVAKTTDMRVLHLADFAAHYTRTLRAWRARFRNSLDRVRALEYSERFIRLWEYYLCYCEAAFSERHVGVVQMLLAKPGSRRDLYAASAAAGQSALAACELAGSTA